MTVIICPACGTRYEIAAAIPPEGRRVRCSKCSHVWQATAVIEGAQPPPMPVPRPPATEARPAPPPPRPAPMAPRPARPEPGGAKDQFTGFSPKQAEGLPSGGRPAREPGRGASYGEEEFQPDVPPGGDWPAPQSTAEPAAQDYGSFDAGAPSKPAAESATKIPIIGKLSQLKLPQKLPPPVAIGWGGLALLLVILAALVALAPKTVVSILPGANRLYAMMGTPVNVSGLAIVDVKSQWGVARGQQVLQVVGNIVNLTSGEVTVPAVLVALLDEGGKVIGEVPAKVAPLAAGARAPFGVQIASPPETVRSVKVRLAKAN